MMRPDEGAEGGGGGGGLKWKARERAAKRAEDRRRQVRGARRRGRAACAVLLSHLGGLSRHCGVMGTPRPRVGGGSECTVGTWVGATVGMGGAVSAESWRRRLRLRGVGSSPLPSPLGLARWPLSAAHPTPSPVAAGRRSSGTARARSPSLARTRSATPAPRPDAVLSVTPPLDAALSVTPPLDAVLSSKLNSQCEPLRFGFWKWSCHPAFRRWAVRGRARTGEGARGAPRRGSGRGLAPRAPWGLARAEGVSVQ